MDENKTAPRKVRLNDAAIGAVTAPQSGRRYVWDDLVSGFGIRITSRGVISFIVAKRARRGDAQVTHFNLGRYPAGAVRAEREKAISGARLKAKDLLAELAAGIDPRERQAAERKAQEEKAKADAARQKHFFETVAEDFITEHVEGKRTATDIKGIINREFTSRWRGKPIGEITRADVVKAITEIAAKSPSGARQALVWIRVLFDWALNTDDRRGLSVSPCADIKPKALKLPKVAKGKRILTDAELSLVWRAATGEWPTPMGRTYGVYVRGLMATACRRKEIADLERGEIDESKCAIFLAAERCKNGEPRLIPLSAMALEIIQSVPRWNKGSYIFSTTNGERPISGFSKAKAALDERIKMLNGGQGIAPWKLHDLRRTARTRLGALPIEHHVRELMIGHAQPELEGVYDLHAYQAEQRAGFELWAARLMSIVNPQPDNVVTLRSA